MAGHPLEQPQEINCRILDKSPGGSEDEPSECPVCYNIKGPSGWLTKSPGGSEIAPTRCSTSHPEARTTSLPSAPSATATEDSTDDSPSHPEATPSGCS